MFTEFFHIAIQFDEGLGPDRLTVELFVRLVFSYSSAPFRIQWNKVNSGTLGPGLAMVMFAGIFIQLAFALQSNARALSQ